MTNTNADDRRRAARERKRQQRARERDAQVLASATVTDDDPTDAGSDQTLPAGITQPTGADDAPTRGLMEEQALWVKRRRQITELELQRRQGEMIPRVDAERQAAALTRRIRAALDRAPSLLPGDLSVENQAACRKAMAAAINQALKVME